MALKPILNKSAYTAVHETLWEKQWRTCSLKWVFLIKMLVALVSKGSACYQ